MTSSLARKERKRRGHEDRASSNGVTQCLDFALIGLALFWPAGTFDYWQAWVFLGIFVVLSAIYTVYVGMKNPEVLRAADACRAGP